MWPTVKALRAKGGTARIDEISEHVIEQIGLSDEQQALIQPGHSMSIINYRLAWTRTYLKNVKAVENSSRGVWALTEYGRMLTEEQTVNLDKRAREKYQLRKQTGGAKEDTDVLADDDPDISDDDADPDRWKSDLLDRLLALSPDAFERLAQHLLREAGFLSVEVLGRSGDGGLDGVGVYRLSLVSFPTYFQCKRYKGAVPAGAVRDFRGAMSGRGDKGLLITTGSFTRGAREEATRDGAPPVDLVSGDELCDLLKEYRLGVKVTERTIEDIEVDPGFFDQF